MVQRNDTASVRQGMQQRLPYIQGGPKNLAHFVRLITSSNIDQFSNCLHCQNREEIFSNTIT